MSFIEMESSTRLGNIAYSGITDDEKRLLSDMAHRALADLGYDTESATLMKIINLGNGIYLASFTLPLDNRINFSFSVDTELYKVNNSPNGINDSPKTKSKPYASIW